MIFERQKRLLALLDTLGGEISNLDYQKLLFLFCYQVEESPTYEFVPYKFGGFSFTSYADKRRLIEQGFLVNDERIWCLTPLGRSNAAVAPQVQSKMAGFAQHYADLRGDKLVAKVYRQYPYHAINSEIAARVLAGDPARLQAIEQARPQHHIPGICTIGYEGRSLEGYLNILIRSGVSILCDVRKNPLSRKYGFSKGTLSNACSGVGIIYMHLPELGIATEERRNLVTQADYDALFETYRSNTLPQQTVALMSIKELVAHGNYLALTCYEADARQCHRQCVAEELEKLYGTTFIPDQL